MAYGVHFNLVNGEKKNCLADQKDRTRASAAHMKSFPLFVLTFCRMFKKKIRQIKAWKNNYSSSHTNTNLTTTITTMKG